MKVEVIQYSNSANPEMVAGKVAVVIDVLRATSVITTALANKAKAVITSGTVEEALATRKKLGRANCVLGGERGMQKIAGFHYGNSPLDYSEANVKNKTVILTTTNGTQAINYCRESSELYICSFLNCVAVANHLTMLNKDVAIVCSGTRNIFSLDDACCAGMLLTLLCQQGADAADDYALMHKAGYEPHQNDIVSLVKNSKSYQMLLDKGYGDDLLYCLRMNVNNIVPKYISQQIVSLQKEIY